MKLAGWGTVNLGGELELYLKVYGELSKDNKHESNIIRFYFRKVTFCCMDLIERNQDQKPGDMTNVSKREMVRLN